ncbi:MAG: T9SS type A sorting domain-containing protein [Flavobacteriales bacterium]|nr:T9SS type A sorting domain-containing protein [Flavobacteriales bacterium]
MAYDSWFTIGADPNPNNITAIFDPLSNAPLTSQFEDNRSGFLVNDFIGGAVFSSQVPPVAPGIPTADGEVLFAQLTSDGIITGTLNFQMRALNPDGTIFLDGGGDVVVILASGISLDLTPGVLPDQCSIQFLPIELVDFTAEESDGKVNLNWHTLSEVDNDYFTVERSTDLQNWEVVVKIDGAGTTNAERFYISQDATPYTGTSYYRLKQVDFNGDYTYSELRSVYIERAYFNVFPNPARNQILVSVNERTVRSIELLSTQGQVLKETRSSVGARQIMTSDLPSGVYFVRVIYKNGDTEQRKVMVQH